MTLLPAVFARVPILRRFIAPLCACIVMLGFAAITIWAARNNVLTVSAQPDRTVTELYFTHPNDIPTAVTAGQTNTVSFTVSSHLQNIHTYHYQVVVAEAGRTTQAAAGSMTLRSGASDAQTVSYVVPEAAAAATVSVILANEHQVIQYHVRSL